MSIRFFCRLLLQPEGIRFAAAPGKISLAERFDILPEFIGLRNVKFFDSLVDRSTKTCDIGFANRFESLSEGFADRPSRDGEQHIIESFFGSTFTRPDQVPFCGLLGRVVIRDESAPCRLDKTFKGSLFVAGRFQPLRIEKVGGDDRSRFQGEMAPVTERAVKSSLEPLSRASSEKK